MVEELNSDPEPGNKEKGDLMFSPRTEYDRINSTHSKEGQESSD